jgi:adenylate cyclase
MSIEIERRFLVSSDEWRVSAAVSRSYRQSYLSRTSESSVRVRRFEDHATITVKGPRVGLARDEFEYRIPAPDADYMLGKMCVTPIIEKVRHLVDHAGMTWEVDVYHGEACGLVLAEVELDRIDQPLVLPQWVAAEVTHDPRYCSSGIVQGLWRDADLRLAR